MVCGPLSASGFPALGVPASQRWRDKDGREGRITLHAAGKRATCHPSGTRSQPICSSAGTISGRAGTDWTLRRLDHMYPAKVNLQIHRAAFVLSAIAALLCVPAILLTERLRWPDDPFSILQLVLCAAAAIGAGTFLWRTRRTFDRSRSVAWAVAVAATAWLAFVVVVAVVYSSSMSQFD